MLKNLTIGKQIGIGISLILVVSAIVTTFAMKGLKRSASSFSEYRTFARESVLSGRVQANMLIASNAAREFMKSRNEAAAVTFEERYAAAREFALEQQASMDDPRRLEMSKELVQKLDYYDDKAHEAFDMMRRRDAILQEQLNPQGVKMREALQEVMVSANRDEDSEAAYLAGIALKRVMLGRVHLLRFLLDNKSEDIVRVRSELGKGFEQAYNEMAQAIENPERQQRLRDFSAAREIYLAAFEEMVALIETRNNLLDRELGPLDKEISDIAERIKLSLKQTQDTLGPKVEAANARTVRAVIAGFVVGALIAIFIAWSIIRAVTRPVADLMGTVKDVQESGDLSKRLTVQSRNEIGAVAGTLNGFLGSLEAKSNIARNVAEGNLETKVDVLSERDTMGHALCEMLDTLKESEKESEQGDWARSGQQRLNDEMRGVDDQQDLVSRVITFLCKHLDAQRGAIYLCLKDPDVLEHGARYAGDDRLGGEKIFAVGEGLVGQTAKDREPIVVDDVPEDYFKIQSSLGEVAPRGLLLFPLAYEDRLLGVLEVASVGPIEEHKVEFLHAVQESICVALLSAERQTRLATALEEGKRINFLSDIALDLSDCAYWHVDYSDPEYYYMSERAAKMLGEPPRDGGRYHLQDEWFSRLVEANPETAELTSERYQGAIDGKYDSYDSTYAYKRPSDGEVIWLHAAGDITRGEDGKIEYMYGVYQDVTERVQSEEALRKSEERFDLAVRGSGDGLWDHIPATGEMWFSDKFRELLGYSSVEEYPNLAESWSNGLHPNDHDKIVAAFAAHLESDVPYDVEYQLKTKSGKYRWFRARSISLRDDKGKAYRAAGSLTDITDQKKAKAEVVKAQAAAESANKAKSEFLSNMSHELRTPLNGVLGYAQILQRDRTLGASQKKSLESINSCGEHLLNLINDVLDLSKIEAGQLEISAEATDLSKLLDGVRDIVSPRAENKGLQFILKASPEVPRGIVTDPIKLRQVLINLLGNSVKFTPEGTISLRVAEAEKGFLRFEIEDTGMGIGPEKLKEIFDPFKQAEGGKTEGGTGLGLAISRRIAEAMGGSLTATSEIGEGSCFTLNLPLEETDDIKGDDFTSTVPGADVHFRLPEGVTRSVLIADDRETNRDILEHVMSDAGFEVVLTTDGDEALEELRKRDFDIFLCDVRMPRMNGIEVIKEVRADEKLKDAKVFAVTASVFPEFRDQALEAGFDDFLMKPLRVAELAEKLSHILEIEFDGELVEEMEEGGGTGEDPVEMFNALPADILQELAAASRVRNLTKLGEIASRLLENEQTSVPGHHLEGLLVTFDFAGLKTLADGLKAPAETEDSKI